MHKRKPHIIRIKACICAFCYFVDFLHTFLDIFNFCTLFYYVTISGTNMFVYSHILSTFLTGFVFLLQISFNQASGAKLKPSASVQVTQTFILPFYLKSKPLSEKKLVFRKALSFFPFLKKIPEYIASSGNIRG